MDNKKLSIIVPIYNVELYIKECIESLLEQTYSNMEIILVDDGSLDNSGVICDQIAQENPVIKVIHQVNQGLPYARNAGLEVATGDYIGFIDSDDYISKEMYKEMIMCLEESKSDLVICNFQTFNKLGNNPIHKRYEDDVIVYDKKNTLRFYQCALDSSWNKVYRNDVIRNNGIRFEDKNIVAQEDFWFLVRYCSHISKITTVSKGYYYYRERKSSITKSRSDNDIVSRCMNFIELSEKYLDDYGRKSDDFHEYLIMNLMFASINNISSPSRRDIKAVITAFKNCNDFDSAVKRQLKISKGQANNLRGFYNGLLYLLLQKKMYWLFSVLESTRVKRLYTKKRTDTYFE